MLSDITICSMNVRGLGDKLKRADVLDWLRSKKYSIYCLQDVHLTAEQESKFEKDWGFKCIFSSYKSNSRGVAILLQNNFEFKLNITRNDATGNFVATEIECENTKMTLINIYGPNDDNPSFYKEIVREYQNATICLCGDWNLVQDYDLDTQGYKGLNNPKARKLVIDMKNEFELVDPWRVKWPNSRRYTWTSSSKPRKHARLDFFLISGDIQSQCSEVNIDKKHRSDHSLISIKLNIFKEPRGRGFFGN